MENWFKGHNFPYIKTENGAYYWQTNIATGELTPNGKIIWHKKNFFEKIKMNKEKQK